MNISSKNLELDFFLQTLGLLRRLKGIFLHLISDAIKQGVNDNSGRGLNL